MRGIHEIRRPAFGGIEWDQWSDGWTWSPETVEEYLFTRETMQRGVDTIVFTSEIMDDLVQRVLRLEHMNGLNNG